MTDRVRLTFAGETCSGCHVISWGGEMWHMTRGSVACPECHGADDWHSPATAQQEPTLAPVAITVRVPPRGLSAAIDALDLGPMSCGPNPRKPADPQKRAKRKAQRRARKINRSTKG